MLSSPKDKVLALLTRAGYDAGEEGDGDIVINDCTVAQLDSKNDPVLCALVGITPAGSCLTLYGADNSQWQVRYDEAKKWTVRGKVVFPQDDRDFPHEFQPGE